MSWSQVYPAYELHNTLVSLRSKDTKIKLKGAKHASERVGRNIRR